MTCKPLAIAALAALFPLAALAQAGPYKVLQTVKVGGGEGGFDYVTADSADRTLYVARSGQAPNAHIGVYSLDTFAQVGDIPGVSSHGGMVDPETGHGFAMLFLARLLDGEM